MRFTPSCLCVKTQRYSLEQASQVLPVYLAYQTCSCVNFTFKGRLDGCGRQMAFARISMFSWYLVGIPVAAATVFWWHLGVVRR